MPTTGHLASALCSWAAGVDDGAEARAADVARLRDGRLGAAIAAIPYIVRRTICNGSEAIIGRTARHLRNLLLNALIIEYHIWKYKTRENGKGLDLRFGLKP